MKCPNKECGYTHNIWDDETKHPQHEKHGEFWKLPVKMEQEDSNWNTDRASLYACPLCKIAFVE